LTGEPPQIRPVRAWTTGSLYPGMARVNLDVHPTLTPKEVAAEWSRVRRAILGDRHRNLSEKHLELAIFNVAAAPGESLAARMKRWNREVAARRMVKEDWPGPGENWVLLLKG